MLTSAPEQTDISMNEKNIHIPVMHAEVQEYLNLPSGGCFVDCTLGGGGHSKLIASQLGPQGRIIGIDRDRESLHLARENLGDCRQCDFIHDDFRNIDKILDSLGIDQVDGMLFDLGISSLQLDDPKRGFSLKTEGPLDMRMDQDGCLLAYDLINTLSEHEIALILKDYGQERWHKRIARRIVSKRPLETTKDLSDIVLEAIPYVSKRERIHPATRTFQAFRIAVNRELESLEIALQKSVGYLKVGARICVISFHSLEDRIVKQRFRFFAKEKRVKLIVKKPLRPQDNEVSQNPRSRSARLRVAERIS